MPRDLATSLVYARSRPLIGRLAYYALKLLGVEIPLSVRIGRDLELAHGGFGVVIHPRTTIGDRVKIYPGVGLGRADIHLPAAQSAFEGIRSKTMSSWRPAPRCYAKRACCASVAAVWWAPTPSCSNLPASTRSGLAYRRAALAGESLLKPKHMTTPSSPRICIVPPLSGVGGMVSFQGRLAQGLARRGISVTYNLDDAPFQTVLVDRRHAPAGWLVARFGAKACASSSAWTA